jgi:hypothetical protein
MKIIVDIANYMNTKDGLYPVYENGVRIDNIQYEVGQVVAVMRKDKFAGKEASMELAVVLGCMSQHEVRLDLCGMTPTEWIRPANAGDFGKSWVKSRDKLTKECQGYNVTYDWDTHELTIEEPLMSETIDFNWTK